MNFVTNSLQEAHDQMAQYICSHSLRAEGDSGNLSFQHSWTKVGGLGVNAVCYGVPVEIVSQFPEDMYSVLMVLKGVAEIERGETATTVAKGSIYIVNPADRLRMRLSADQLNVAFCFPVSSLQQYIKIETDIAVTEPLLFQSPKGENDAAESQLARTLSWLYGEFSQPQSMLQNPLVGPHLEKALFGLLLSELSHNQTELFSRQMASPVPNYVRRAEAFIVSHYDEPITVESITNAANISLRALQNGFRRFRDTTPMNFLRDYRLDQANRLLKQSYPQARSVTEVAVDSGFMHLGKFAKRYKERFGETPSDTLKSQVA